MIGEASKVRASKNVGYTPERREEGLLVATAEENEQFAGLEQFAAECLQACEFLAEKQECTKEQAFWMALAWRTLEEAKGKVAPMVPSGASQGEAQPEPGVAGGASSCAVAAPWAQYLEKGDIFAFGRYPSGANGEVKPIEWQVLWRYNGGLLAISKYALDCKRYNEQPDRRITWERCSLRRWLNGEFLYKAFNEEERRHIKTTHLSNYHSQCQISLSNGPDTDDKVFLFSNHDAIFGGHWMGFQLFSYDEILACKATAYAQACGVETLDNGLCDWWWRDPGRDPRDAVCVARDGDRYYSDAFYGFYAVRPALHIALERSTPDSDNLV